MLINCFTCLVQFVGVNVKEMHILLRSLDRDLARDVNNSVMRFYFDSQGGADV